MLPTRVLTEVGYTGVVITSHSTQTPLFSSPLSLASLSSSRGFTLPWPAPLQSNSSVSPRMIFGKILQNGRTLTNRTWLRDHGHTEYRSWYWNCGLLLRAPLLLGRDCVRNLQYLHHHMLHFVDPKDTLLRPHAADHYGCSQRVRSRLHGQRHRRTRRIGLWSVVFRHLGINLRQVPAKQSWVESCLFRWRLFHCKGRWLDSVHHFRGILDHRIHQKCHPHNYSWNLRNLVLLRWKARRNAKGCYTRRIPSCHDIQLWQHQLWQSSRRPHQHVETGCQYRAAARGSTGQHHRQHCILLPRVFDWFIRLGCSVHVRETRGPSKWFHLILFLATGTPSAT